MSKFITQNIQCPVGYCTHQASQLQVAATGLPVVHWQVLGWSVNNKDANTSNTSINITSPSARSRAHTHTWAHAYSTCIINKLTTACDAKRQHAVALLTSPASGHCNDSFFFLPANVIDTHAEETGQSCCPACLSDFPGGTQSTYDGGESCSAAHTCSQSEWMPVQRCFLDAAHLTRKMIWNGES